MSIGAYILRRLLWGVGVLVGVMVITFAVRYVLPADPARIVGGLHASPEVLAGIRRQYGFDRPLPAQLLAYAGNLLHGDFGMSLLYGTDVGTVLRTRGPQTIELVMAGLLVALGAGLPLGVAAALRHASLVDRAAVLVALLSLSLPAFWLGPVLFAVFAVRLKALPADGSTGLPALVIPALTLGLAGIAWYTRLIRSSMLDALGSDYIRTARAKGLPWGQVVRTHALRNAITPVVTQVGLDLGYLFGSVVVVEKAVGWPGIGQAAADAIASDDPNLIMGVVLVGAVAVVLANLAADVCRALIDPRVRL